MSAYYNEHDPFAAAWLRELIKAGLIADGEVDERDIQDVSADDVRGFIQCHFFAGIGGWSLGLRLADWPHARPVWTGSCPCQPFSVAGRGHGETDQRDLWPVWFALIAECQPATLFGEQVSGSVAASWYDRVADDLEGQDYAVAAADLCAPSVGAPHIRQRLYWVGATDHRRERSEGKQPQAVSRESAFSWCENVRSVEDLRGRSDLPPSLIRSYRDGLPNGLGGVHGYGNAIVPQVAAEVIAAYMEIRA